MSKQAKSRKRLIIIAASAVVLVATSIGALVGTSAPINNKSNGKSGEIVKLIMF
jgi:hypothetical protein